MKTQRVLLDVDLLINPLTTGSGVGLSLKYEPIYDEIREARREEDTTLSLGIWERELKKADWIYVEELCYEALTKQTKDLQIFTWLCEAWVILDGFQGLERGLKSLNLFCDAFWEKAFPLVEESDFEHRLRIFEWFDKALSDRTLFINLLPEKGFPPLTLGKLNYAINLEGISKRSHEGKTIIQQAEEKGEIPLEKFRKIFYSFDKDYYKNHLEQLEKIKEQLALFIKKINQKLENQSPSFSLFQKDLDDIYHLFTAGYSRTEKKEIKKNSAPSSLITEEENFHYEPAKDQEASPQDGGDTIVVTGKKEAYQALRDISQLLKSIEPHSPIPPLIELLTTWENKTFLQILSDLSKGHSEPYQLLRLLGANIPTSPATPPTQSQPSSLPPSIPQPQLNTGDNPL